MEAPASRTVLANDGVATVKIKEELLAMEVARAGAKVEAEKTTGEHSAVLSALDELPCRPAGRRHSAVGAALSDVVGAKYWFQEGNVTCWKEASDADINSIRNCQADNAKENTSRFRRPGSRIDVRGGDFLDRWTVSPSVCSLIFGEYRNKGVTQRALVVVLEVQVTNELLDDLVEQLRAIVVEIKRGRAAGKVQRRVVEGNWTSRDLQQRREVRDELAAIRKCGFREAGICRHAAAFFKRKARSCEASSGRARPPGPEVTPSNGTDGTRRPPSVQCLW